MDIAEESWLTGGFVEMLEKFRVTTSKSVQSVDCPRCCKALACWPQRRRCDTGRLGGFPKQNPKTAWNKGTKRKGLGPWQKPVSFLWRSVGDGEWSWMTHPMPITIIHLKQAFAEPLLTCPGQPIYIWDILRHFSCFICKLWRTIHKPSKPHGPHMALPTAWSSDHFEAAHLTGAKLGSAFRDLTIFGSQRWDVVSHTCLDTCHVGAVKSLKMQIYHPSRGLKTRCLNTFKNILHGSSFRGKVVLSNKRGCRRRELAPRRKLRSKVAQQRKAPKVQTKIDEKNSNAKATNKRTAPSIRCS